MKAAMLLQKLEREADIAFEKECRTRNLGIVHRNVRPPPTPPSKADQSRTQLIRLRKQTAEIENELELERQVEDEFQQYVLARKRRNRKLS
jgi:hypothetical protein